GKVSELGQQLPKWRRLETWLPVLAAIPVRASGSLTRSAMPTLGRPADDRLHRPTLQIDSHASPVFGSAGKDPTREQLPKAPLWPAQDGRRFVDRVAFDHGADRVTPAVRHAIPAAGLPRTTCRGQRPRKGAAS